MGLFSKSNKDKKNEDITLIPLFDSSFKDGGRLQINAYIYDFNNFINYLSLRPISQMFWNDIKEKFGKEVDEKELYKVFKFFELMLAFGSILEDIKNNLLDLSTLTSEQSYIFYKNKNFFNGNLDETTFRRLVAKIWVYYIEEFYEKYKKYKEQNKQNKEQKDEQPK